MNTQIVTVNLTPGLSAPAVVKVSQYDVGRPLTIRVLDGTGVASFGSSVTATIVGTKPSGLGFSETGTISGSTVTLNTTLTMTQECGMIPAEIRFTTSSPATVIGTANFILAVEPSPHPDGTTDGTQETMADLQTQLNGLDTRVTALEAGGGGGSGLTDDIKTALLQIAEKVAYIDAHGQDYYDDLYDALYNDTTRSVLLVLSHVSSSNTQSTVEVGDSYTTTLTASTNYTLNSVSVTMGGVDVTSTTYSSGTVSIPSVTGNIVISASAVLAAQSITATYTQSGTVYDTDSLDSLKADLVVTANYSGGTSETVPASDYTLSGTLTAGTSTVTVNYAGLTTTFTVTVTHESTVLGYKGDNLLMLIDGIANGENGVHNTTISTLVDQSGNNKNWTASNGSVTAPDTSLVFDHSSNLQATWEGVMTEPKTVEIVCDISYTNTTQCVICGLTVSSDVTSDPAKTGIGALSVKSGNLLHYTGSTYGCLPISSGVHTYTFVNRNGTWYGYIDGVATSFSSTTASWKTYNKRLGSFADWNTAAVGYYFWGEIYSMRYYSEALSDSDITSNRANDVTRFSL